MMSNISMEKVVITGASRGIGKATAEKFLKEGWKVIGTSIDGKGWSHNDLSWVSLDLSDPDSVINAVEIIRKESPIDVLVNNAGTYVAEEDFQNASITRKNLRTTLEVNVIGTIDITEQLLSSLKPDGRIITLGSRSGALVAPEVNTSAPSYRISKTALSMYTRLLSQRLRDTKLVISIIDPGWVKTDMGGSDAERDPQEPANEIFALAILDVPSGKFWRQGRERTW